VSKAYLFKDVRGNVFRYGSYGLQDNVCVRVVTYSGLIKMK